MFERVLKTIREQSLFGRGETVIVAVSGGADSVALLDILASLEELRLDLIVAHLNHSLRGEESDGDEAFVRNLTAHYHFPCEVKRVDVRMMSIREKLSLEEAGRVARYAFFNDLAGTFQASAIALGHHAGDQAETVLMRLVRGTGAAGLAGIAPKGGNVVRPLLGVTRGEIEAYLKKRWISYRNDSSNSDLNFLRNRIRHELLPYLASYNPLICDHLVALAQSLASDEVLLEELTDQAFVRHGSFCKSAAKLRVSSLVQERSGLRLRLYRRAILLAKGDLLRISYRNLHAIDRLFVSTRTNSSLDLPGEVRVVRSYDTVSFIATPEPRSDDVHEVVLESTGTYLLPGGDRLLIEEAEVPDSWRDVPPAIAYFDAEKVPFPWLVRSFRPGDRVVPLGMSGHKKVKDIFIDEKIPRETRRRLPLVFSGEKLIWVCTLRVSSETCITERTRKVVKAEILDFTP